MVGWQRLGALIFTALLLASAGVKAQSTTSPAEALSGEQVFNSSCASCHGLDGRGGEHAPNIVGSERVQSLSHEALRKTISNGIPSAGMPGFAQLLDRNQIGAVLDYLHTLRRNTKNQIAGGDLELGRKVFFKVGRCSNCHMVGGQGGYLGKDLSGYGMTHTAESIRESIVHPNNNPDVHHGTVIVVTRTGKTLEGIVRNEDSFSVQMQTADGVFHLFEKSTLHRLEHSTRSMMPSDYENTLTRSQLDDLVIFVSNAPVVEATKLGRDIK